jgi:hypothetical protein
LIYTWIFKNYSTTYSSDKTRYSHYLDLNYQDFFKFLKLTFITIPRLCHLDPQQRIVIETDISDYIFSGILSQYEDNGILYLIAYFFENYSSGKYNYIIYNQELLVIFCTIEEWCPFTERSAYKIDVLTDYNN